MRVGILTRLTVAKIEGVSNALDLILKSIKSLK